MHVLLSTLYVAIIFGISCGSPLADPGSIGDVHARSTSTLPPIPPAIPLFVEQPEPVYDYEAEETEGIFSAYFLRVSVTIMIFGGVFICVGMACCIATTSCSLCWGLRLGVIKVHKKCNHRRRKALSTSSAAVADQEFDVTCGIEIKPYVNIPHSYH